jgi:hypothetical protein
VWDESRPIYSAVSEINLYAFGQLYRRTELYAEAFFTLPATIILISLLNVRFVVEQVLVSRQERIEKINDKKYEKVL